MSHRGGGHHGNVVGYAVTDICNLRILGRLYMQISTKHVLAIHHLQLEVALKCHPFTFILSKHIPSTLNLCNYVLSIPILNF